MLLIGILANARSGPVQFGSEILAQGGDFSPHALDDATQAYNRALELAPSGIQPTSHVERMKTRFNAASWYAQATPQAGATGKLTRPAWIVGILASGLTECALLAMDMPCDDSTSVPGLYYVFNANNAMLISAGMLNTTLWSQLQSMSNDTVVISLATPGTLAGTAAGSPMWGVPQILTPTP